MPGASSILENFRYFALARKCSHSVRKRAASIEKGERRTTKEKVLSYVRGALPCCFSGEVSLELLRRGVFERPFGQAARFKNAPFADRVFDERNVARGHRKFSNPKSYEDRNHRGVGGALAAENHRLPGVVR